MLGMLSPKIVCAHQGYASEVLSIQHSRPQCMMPAALRHLSQAPHRHLSMGSSHRLEGGCASGKHMPLVNGRYEQAEALSSRLKSTLGASLP